MFFVVITSIILLIVIDIRVSKILEQYINVEVERYVNNIVSKAVRERIEMFDFGDYVVLNNSVDSLNKVKTFSYNTVKINEIQRKLEEIVQQKLLDLENGEVEDYFIPLRIKTGRFKKAKKSLLCDVSLGSIKNSSLFANVGPTIPIKLIFTGQTNAEVEFKKREYGINSIMIEAYVRISISEQAIMPISSKTKTIVLREPISIDIINGEIPNYYGSYIK